MTRKFYNLVEIRPSQKWHKSRIERKCQFCDGTIQKGDLWRMCGKHKNLVICAPCDRPSEYDIIGITVSTHEDMLGEYADDARKDYEKRVGMVFSKYPEYKISFDEGMQNAGWECSTHLNDEFDNEIVSALLDEAWNSIGD